DGGTVRRQVPLGRSARRRAGRPLHGRAELRGLPRRRHAPRRGGAAVRDHRRGLRWPAAVRPRAGRRHPRPAAHRRLPQHPHPRLRHRRRPAGVGRGGARPGRATGNHRAAARRRAGAL
ncbi:MAG: Protein of unknown function DUF86, BT0167 group, partial [uncultured Acetobacteraceae bacterium]